MIGGDVQKCESATPAAQRSTRVALQDVCGAQIVEFAVALPLLVLFVVGIFDFSTAFTLKQRFTNIARDAARSAAADPANDLAQPQGAAPMSVQQAFQEIDTYFTSSNLNDCGAALSGPASNLTWTYSGTANGCTAPGLSIIINRGYYFSPGAPPPNANCQSQAPGAQIAVVGTCVSIEYAYPWKFGRIANMFGRSAILPAQISAQAVALNEN